MELENIICNQKDILSLVKNRRKYPRSPKAAHLESCHLWCPGSMSGMLQIMWRVMETACFLPCSSKCRIYCFISLVWKEMKIKYRWDDDFGARFLIQTFKPAFWSISYYFLILTNKIHRWIFHQSLKNLNPRKKQYEVWSYIGTLHALSSIFLMDCKDCEIFYSNY